jgi:hypothetical protein
MLIPPSRASHHRLGIRRYRVPLLPKLSLVRDRFGVALKHVKVVENIAGTSPAEFTENKELRIHISA